MIDQIYNWFSIQDIVLFISLITYFGLWIDYIDKKLRRKERKRCNLQMKKVKECMNMK